MLPIDLDRGTPEGALERITGSPANRAHASLSNNGRNVAFAANQSGQQEISIDDLVAERESIVASSPFVERTAPINASPVIDAAGTRIAYSVQEGDKRVVYVSAPGGAPEKLCEGCLRATGWSRDD